MLFAANVLRVGISLSQCIIWSIHVSPLLTHIPMLLNGCTDYVPRIDDGKQSLMILLDDLQVQVEQNRVTHATMITQVDPSTEVELHDHTKLHLIDLCSECYCDTYSIN